MFVLCWSAKGGSGTTFAATAMALARPGPALVADLAGDVPTILGLATPCTPGIGEWLDSTAPPDRLDDLLVDAGHSLHVLHRGANSARLHDDDGADRRADLADWLCACAEGRFVVADAGTGEPPAELAAAASARLLVTRPCYLALHRARSQTARPDGIVLVDEHGHHLRDRDVEHVIGAPVVARLPFDPAVARSVDAGMLATRLPVRVVSELRSVGS